MPLVRILQGIARPGTSWSEGDEVEMSAADAAVWADGVRGELVRGERTERTVARRAPEQTSRR